MILLAMLLLTQAPHPLPEDGDDMSASTRAAAACGWQVVHLPPGFDAEDVPALARAVPPQPPGTPAAWVGTIPSDALYEAVSSAMSSRGARLLNDLEAHRRIFELDRALPLLGELTPRSVVLTSEAGVDAAIDALGLPVFVKGALLSRKHFGWEACVAQGADDLRDKVRRLLARPYFSRGRVIVRELVRLRHHRVPAQDFPIGREYRVFLHRGEPLAHGYYWPYPHDFVALAPAEEAAMLAIAREGARRLGAPFVSVDVGQLEDGRWILIESGDPQFSGLSFIDPRALWRRLTAALAAERGEATPPTPGPPAIVVGERAATG